MAPISRGGDARWLLVLLPQVHVTANRSSDGFHVSGSQCEHLCHR